MLNELKIYNILYIEDDEDDFNYFKSELMLSNRAKFKIDWALDSEKALSLDLNKYDLIVVDYRLPKIDGISLIKKIKENYIINKPFILFTGFSDDKIDNMALSEGIEDYLEKGNSNTQILERTILYSIERWKNKYSILESKALLELVIDSISSCIFLINENGIINRVNKISENYFGKNLVEKMFDNLFDFFPYENNIFNKKISKKIEIENILNKENSKKYYNKGIISHVSGKKFSCEVHGSVIRKNGSKFKMINIIDNTLFENEKEILMKLNKNLENNIKKYGIERKNPSAIMDLVDTEIDKIISLEEA